MDSATSPWSMSRLISGCCTIRSPRPTLMLDCDNSRGAASRSDPHRYGGIFVGGPDRHLCWSKPRRNRLATARQLLDRLLQARLTSIGVSPAPEVKECRDV